MGKTIRTVWIDKELRPAYYDDFHCLMSGCRLNCCHEPWHISFNKSDYLTLRNLKCSADLKRRLKQALCRTHKGDSLYAEFRLVEGVCPMFRKDGLCALQIEQGTRVQPKVCRIFPRKEEYTRFGFLERSLTPACEGVLSLLWELPNGIEFRMNSLPSTMCGTAEIRASDDFCATGLQEIRSLCIDIIQDRRFLLSQRIFRLGMILKDLADNGTDVSRWKQRAEKLAADTEIDAWFAELSGSEKMQIKCMTNNLGFLLALNVQNMIFRDIRMQIVGILAAVERADEKRVMKGDTDTSLEKYFTIRRRYYERFGDREYFMENLMVSLFFYLKMPETETPEALWHSYVKFCSLYSFYRFMAIMSCRDGSAGNRQDLFEIIVHTSRNLLHSLEHLEALPEELFKHDNATLADMAVLLSG